MKHDRKADDKATTPRQADGAGQTPVATGPTDGETSTPRIGEVGFVSPLHAPTKR